MLRQRVVNRRAPPSPGNNTPCGRGNVRPVNRLKSRRRTIAAGCLALLILLIVTLATPLRDNLYSLAVLWFGPPQVTATEAFIDRPPSPPFDHTLLDEVLHRHVDANGGVDYEALLDDRAQLEAYIVSLSDAPLDRLDRAQMLALGINAYNACTLLLVLEHLPLTSIRDIPAADRWLDARWNVGGRNWSLDAIEHEWLRKHFDEPRIHFAIVCASVGCPPLRSEAYTGDRVDRQLTDQVGAVFRDGSRWFRITANGPPPRAAVTSLMWWFTNDFARHPYGSVEAWLAENVPALKKQPPVLSRLNYDWSLNDPSPGSRTRD